MAGRPSHVACRSSDGYRASQPALSWQATAESQGVRSSIASDSHQHSIRRLMDMNLSG